MKKGYGLDALRNLENMMTASEKIDSPIIHTVSWTLRGYGGVWGKGARIAANTKILWVSRESGLPEEWVKRESHRIAATSSNDSIKILPWLNHQIPGFPDHYDYEWHPQEPRSPSRIPWVIHKGALSLSCAASEPISARAVHEWFAEDGRDFFCVGVGTVDIGLGENANASRPAGNEHLKGTGVSNQVFA
ncbi:hypothetical protein BU17DRAFT_71891 [Hysterangium stoloniferum]|nr:hypothetical protein BU17DRAFT_71891 [Hysterangium stoloniferum]